MFGGGGMMVGGLMGWCGVWGGGGGSSQDNGGKEIASGDVSLGAKTFDWCEMLLVLLLL